MTVGTASGRTGSRPRMRAGLRARLAVAGCGTMTVLASGALSACSGSTPAAGPSTFSPAGTLPPTAAILPSGTPSASASSSTSPSATPSTSEPGSPQASPTHSHKASHPSPQPAPTAAPDTGGGGTAGLANVPLLALGGAAVLAGAGSLVYRRRITRNR
jgi:hypothetical protein